MESLNLPAIAFWSGLAVIGYNYFGLLAVGIVLIVNWAVQIILDYLNERY